jgi:hypothetical protein
MKSDESHDAADDDDEDDDDASWGKLLIRPPELPGRSTNRDIWERVGGMDKEARILRISI